MTLKNKIGALIINSHNMSYNFMNVWEIIFKQKNVKQN